MRLYLARHGQSEHQVSRSDDWDSPLTAIGRAQAECLACWLAGEPLLDAEQRLRVECVCTSPLRRAEQTASTVAGSLGVRLVRRENLAEAKFHVSDHLPRLAGPFERAMAGASSEVYAGFAAQALRALSELAGLAREHEGAVLAITHGGLIKTALRVIMGSDASTFRLYNAALHAVEWTGERWRLVHLNLLDHLPSQLRTT